MALIMIAMAAAPGFSPLLGGALDHAFGWRSEFVFVGIFAAVGAIAYGAVLGETHRSTRIPLNPLAIARNYLGLIADRRFLVPAATVSLIMGGLLGIVNPLGTAQALSPFGEKAGAASALLGFWQMMGAAIGVYLAATVSHEAMFALGTVLTVASLLALGLYTMRAKAG